MVAADDHLRLDVRLTPRASRDLLEGETQLVDGRRVLSARVRAIPEKGAANEALLQLIAKSFGVGRSRVSLVTGHGSRTKSVRIEGDPDRLAAALRAHCNISASNKENA
ncbi:MAG: DUF167 domain-containing protein [Hyphomicrobiales bacterium]|nr:DUF167 domain-containing protein [Hyphomicrobiales bacterium]